MRYDPARANRKQLTLAVERAGYRVLPRELGTASEARADALRAAEDQEQRELRRDFGLAAGLTVPLLVLAMSHGALPGTDGPVGRALKRFDAASVEA